mgnify:FL=1
MGEPKLVAILIVERYPGWILQIYVGQPGGWF